MAVELRPTHPFSYGTAGIAKVFLCVLTNLINCLIFIAAFECVFLCWVASFLLDELVFLWDAKLFDLISMY